MTSNQASAVTPQKINEVVSAIWHKRAKENGYKAGTKKYAMAEVEFACGAMAALAAVFGGAEGTMPPEVPTTWIINMMADRQVFGK